MTDTGLMVSDRERQMRYIVEHSADVLARMVYADRLEEEGEPEWAEFIRLDCGIDADIVNRPECHDDSGTWERCRCRAVKRRYRLFEADPARTLRWFGLPRPWARVASPRSGTGRPTSGPGSSARAARAAG